MSGLSTGLPTQPAESGILDSDWNSESNPSNAIPHPYD